MFPTIARRTRDTEILNRMSAATSKGCNVIGMTRFGRSLFTAPKANARFFGFPRLFPIAYQEHIPDSSTKFDGSPFIVSRFILLWMTPSISRVSISEFFGVQGIGRRRRLADFLPISLPVFSSENLKFVSILRSVFLGFFNYLIPFFKISGTKVILALSQMRFGILGLIGSGIKLFRLDEIHRNKRCPLRVFPGSTEHGTQRAFVNGSPERIGRSPKQKNANNLQERPENQL